MQKSEKEAPGRAIRSNHPTPHPRPKRPSYPPKVGLGRVSKQASSNKERSDIYGGVIFDIPGHPTWRLVTCPDGLQYILQQREARDHWEGRKYLHRKSRLAAVLEEIFGPETLLACRDRIAALPI